MSGYENVKLAGITFKEMDGQKLSMIFGVGWKWLPQDYVRTRWTFTECYGTSRVYCLNDWQFEVCNACSQCLSCFLMFAYWGGSRMKTWKIWMSSVLCNFWARCREWAVVASDYYMGSSLNSFPRIRTKITFIAYLQDSAFKTQLSQQTSNMSEKKYESLIRVKTLANV